MVTVGDVWTDIDRINQKAAERLGYPTQKPLKLLHRIISAATNPGDVVLDPFCGCGTSVEAAQSLGRSWIGVDVAIHAINLIKSRMDDSFGNDLNYEVHGIPEDFASAQHLADVNKYQFQWWANYLFNPHAVREMKKGADRGVDGELFFPNGPQRPLGRIIISVKGGKTVGPSMVRDLGGTLNAEGAEMGLFVCLRAPTSAMRKAAHAEGFAEVVHGDIPKVQIVSIEEWFAGQRPVLPPLHNLPSTAFSKTRRRAAIKPKLGKRADPREPEFMFEFPSAQDPEDGTVRHLNPFRVKRVAEAS